MNHKCICLLNLRALGLPLPAEADAAQCLGRPLRSAGSVKPIVQALPGGEVRLFPFAPRWGEWLIRKCFCRDNHQDTPLAIRKPCGDQPPGLCGRSRPGPFPEQGGRPQPSRPGWAPDPARVTSPNSSDQREGAPKSPKNIVSNRWARPRGGAWTREGAQQPRQPRERRRDEQLFGP